MANVSQPAWHMPQSQDAQPRLQVYNSLTRSKVDLVTRKPGVVTWYNCGPTVYDTSHMGHARNYMTQDIMRRVLRDYFGYEVHFVMNITDVDDKIIVRARQSHLLEKYSSLVESGNLSSATVAKDVRAAWDKYVVEKLLKDDPSIAEGSSIDAAWMRLLAQAEDQDWVNQKLQANEKWSMFFDNARRGREELDKSASSEGRGTTSLLEANRELLSSWLDDLQGTQISDPAIFRDLAQYWEKDFFDSMRKLRVETPTTVTRVSEYIPEIVDYVAQIMERGFAYEGDGSIWFDTGKFDGAEDKEGPHHYAKLQPWSKGNRDLLAEGEGSLTAANGKRSAADFALWKASKPGEPRWPSPWGPGRPGWHIECSVMASAVLGEGMDVHSGGIDLAFPHHDNELAQSEAYHGCRQWVNYFLHTGHLHIEGLKMSKSLKNFISINEALEKYSARQLRLAFLNTVWSARLDFKDSAMAEVRSSETSINNFFDNVAAFLRESGESKASSTTPHHNYNSAEKDLLQQLTDTQSRFRSALSDSFDTPAALRLILDLINVTNVYMSRGRKLLNLSVLSAVEDWVTRMLRMFGLGEGPAEGADGRRVIGWGKGDGPASSVSLDRDQLVMPYLRVLSHFRDEVRRLAIAQAPPGDLLQLTDQLRNVDLVDLGVALDDQDDGQALVKLVAPDELRAQRAAKMAEAEEKRQKKAANLAAQETKRRERLDKGRLPPSELFKGDEQYGSFDELGVPLTDRVGEALAKSRRKKLQKEWDAQNKLHQEYLANKSQE